MTKLFYWAVRPTSARDYTPATRIERAESSQRACQLAFGRGLISGGWEAKNLGSRIQVIHSDRKRIALLTDPTGWEPVPSDYRGAKS